MYQMIRYLDEPERLMGLTFDELSIVFIGLLLLIASAYKVLAGLFCLGLYIVLNHFKKGAHPRFLMVLMYWYLPFEISLFFVMHLPSSHLRAWRG
jgi:conjugal transfer pilus assembly protein TraL